MTTRPPPPQASANVSGLPSVPESFPIVGLGASAGGLAAFEGFFSGLGTNRTPGMAFVLVQHLAPDHKSLLSELMRRCTEMRVFEVEDTIEVQVNCVYIIPPHFDMALRQGSLYLSEPVVARGQRLTIDFFFQSLAKEMRERAIGIVLSGTGSDGTVGSLAIKEAGGMVIVQSLGSSEFDCMPRSAIAAGVADFQMEPGEMAAQLVAHAANGFSVYASADQHQGGDDNEGDLKAIFALLRSQTGHDFSQYKPSTVQRRIERRMAVNRLHSIAEYLAFFQKAPDEIGELFRDLLIGVTNFFRDPEAFAVLRERVLPDLFMGKPPGSTVRIWSTGCSTGEEAYSLAILLLEHMETLKQSYQVQVFATDIDDRAVAIARAGLYPPGIAKDISPERLARFFVLEPSGQYRIKKEVRDLLVFSEQDLCRDPPFSRLDLVSCRNLLIYLDADLQRKLIPLFHYALLPGGVLFLGSSEGVGEFDALFGVLDRNAKLFCRKTNPMSTQRNMPSRYISPPSPGDRIPSQHSPRKPPLAAKPPLRELMEQTLLRHVAPASALVNADGDIAYLHGRTGMFLEPSAGESGVQNLLKMARDGLRPSLSTALHQAVTRQSSAFAPRVSVKTNGHYTQVNLSVHPANTDTPSGTTVDTALYLVVLEEALANEGIPPTGTQSSSDLGSGADTSAQIRIQELMLELRAKDEYLQSTNEKLEASNEELKSSNEEMQSVNEELQSTNEELETSKEELQSVNEELATVNMELQTKVSDLSHANNDMNNLLAGTGVGTVFVDFQLRILRFTPAASSIINMIPSDVGRPVAHIVSNLVGYDSLVSDLQLVLNSLVPKEVEVQTHSGQWYTLRIQPYRTLDNVIEGAVISFVEITKMVRVRDALTRTQTLLEHTGELAQVGGWEVNLHSMKVFWTKQMFRIADLEPPLEPSFEDANKLFTPQSREALAIAMRAASERGEPYDLELRLQTANGQVKWGRTQGFAEMQDGKAIRLYGTLQDITDRKAVEEALHQANAQLLAAVKMNPS